MKLAHRGTAPALLALAFGASSMGLRNGWAFDDVYIIALNPRVHQLLDPWEFFRESYWPPDLGGTLYRPASLLGFAIQWKLGGGAPWLFHAVNLILCLAATWVVWKLAGRLLPALAAALVAAFFAVHPVHVEATANVVGQAELVVAILHVVAVAWYLSVRRNGAPGPGVVAGMVVLYLWSCLAKEGGLMLPALLLAAELTVVPATEPWRLRLRRLGPFYAALLGAGAGYLLARSAVLGGVVGEYTHPELRGASLGQRMLTMLGVVPQWWRLLVVPWHLQADYMPLELNRASGLGPAQVLGAAIVAGWGVAAWRARRAYPVSSFGLAWVAVTLFPVSNLAVPIGTLLAERTLFSPSVGALLAIAGLAPWIAARAEASPPWQQRAALTLVAAVLLLFAWRSATRATVWHDDDVLYRQTVLDAPLSYRAHATLGRILFQEGDPGAGEREYRTAIRLYPYDPTVFAGLADHYRAAGLCGPAIPLFRQALDLAPGLGLARTRLIQCLIQVGDLTAAQEELAEKERRKEPDAALLRAAVDSLAGSFRGRPQ